MIGKTLYKAKVKDGKVVMEERTILRVGRKYYHFNEKETQGCLISDVGVVIFLTKEEAYDCLIKQLERSAKMGQAYLTLTLLQLTDARTLRNEVKD